MEGHIWIEGIITQDHHLDIKRQLASLGNVSAIVLHIQSPGGSVYAGYNTYHVLKAAGKPITAVIEGECQSIATFIALAADKVIARNPSVFMIHNPSNEIQGDAQKLEAGASELRNIEKDMIAAYVAKTKLPEDQIRSMMSKQTSMTATQAKEMGFVDEVQEHLRAVAMGKKVTMKKNTFKELGDKIASAIREMMPTGEAKAIALTTTDGATLNVESEDGDLMGKPATIDGQPASGVYALTDGRSVTCVDGIVTEVSEGGGGGDESMRLEIQNLKAQLAALTTENQQLKTAKSTVEQEKVAVTAQRDKGVQMLKELETEFKELKTRTVGDDSPPVGTGKHTVTAGADDWETKARAELFDKHLPFLNKINKK